MILYILNIIKLPTFKLASRDLRLTSFSFQVVDEITKVSGELLYDEEDVENNIIGEGIARSKKEAEQKAAKAALMHFGISNGY